MCHTVHANPIPFLPKQLADAQVVFRVSHDVRALNLYNRTPPSAPTKVRVKFRKILGQDAIYI
jgi:hypothetical protein